MNLNVTLLLNSTVTMDKGVVVEHATSRNREGAVSKALELLNSKLPGEAKVVDFEVGTYTTPVTRRTYGVAVAIYNIPREHRALPDLTIKERRALMAHVLRIFNYNPKVLNISELARTFGVSRDSIYYDIEQILKENGLNR
ncbi:HTH domain-containing protein [Thermococcus sp.]|uniref:HTH domain-containing protein n=1 Tax=Thermococcus sp. TaxID=35749 RepID=UPI0025EEDCAF|nr:HTH domain-containing protein [Thermococcus sp.]